MHKSLIQNKVIKNLANIWLPTAYSKKLHVLNWPLTATYIFVFYGALGA